MANQPSSEIAREMEEIDNIELLVGCSSASLKKNYRPRKTKSVKDYYQGK